MFGEYSHHRAFHGPGSVEHPRCNGLDGLAMLEKLVLSRGARRAPDARELVHGGVADLTFDGLAIVQHDKSESQSLVVIPYDATTRQRHHTSLPRRARTICFVEKMAGSPSITSSRRDPGAPDRSTARSPASPPARCRD